MLVLAMALMAQDITEKAEGWTILTNFRKDECIMSANLKSGADVSFHWRPEKRAGVMIYRAPEFRSIKQNKKYRIEVGFIKAGKLDTGWGERDATGDVGPDGSRGFMVVFSGKEVLSDLAASTKLGFWYKNELVGAVPLTGSAKAIAAVRRCEKAVLTKQVRDPFEQ
ncbi:MAG TPA: hypothetical protein VM662_06320 [Sphingomonas sp.]|nr:hypothetical protein [Sphingomonas sp.]